MKRLVIAWILLASNSIFAAELVSTRLLHGERVLIGDLVVLEVLVRHEWDKQYTLHIDRRGLVGLEIGRDLEVKIVSDEGRYIVTSYRLRLIPFVTGQVPLPPFVIEGQGERLQTPALKLEVSAVTEPQAFEIKDVRLLPSPPTESKLGVSIAVPVFFSILLYLALHYTTRLPNRPLADSVLPASDLKPEDEAISRIRALLSTETDVKMFHVELSAVMSWYVAKRFSCPAQEWTTTEILHYSEGMGLPPLLRDVYSEVLPQCDLVKFACVRPERSVYEGMAYRVIDLFTALGVLREGE
ncbi:MAG: hypothetical protein RMM17_07100 [Acidobacteriota bacterium]|nr:hypothetical protein [Blastocatellia bacterium]MDW8412431.1 hypothetical protein [Acidobacteriota bacterium]